MMLPHPAKQSASSRGVTVVELLVVVAVIAALAMLLFPVLQSISNSASSARCLAGIKEFGTTLLALAADEGGVPPYTLDPDTEKEKAPLPNQWYQRRVGQAPPRCPLKGAEILGFHYAMNLNLSKYYPKLHAIPAPPSRVVFVAEHAYNQGMTAASGLNRTMWASASGAVGREHEGTASPPAYSSKPQYHGAPSRRGLNLFFLDGHAELVFPPRNDWTQSPVYGPINNTQAETNKGYFYDSIHFTRMVSGTLTAF